jgi:hypothetical protein
MEHFSKWIEFVVLLPNLFEWHLLHLLNFFWEAFIEVLTDQGSEDLVYLGSHVLRPLLIILPHCKIIQKQMIWLSVFFGQPNEVCTSVNYFIETIIIGTLCSHRFPWVVKLFNRHLWLHVVLTNYDMKRKPILASVMPKKVDPIVDLDDPRIRAEFLKCRAPLHEECSQHHGHKGDPGVTPGTCDAICERDQVIL